MPSLHNIYGRRDAIYRVRHLISMEQSLYPQRKSPRLKDHDYTEDGSYFVTICTSNRDYHFGDVAEGEMIFNAYGHLATACWLLIPRHYRQVELDLYVVCPIMYMALSF